MAAMVRTSHLSSLLPHLKPEFWLFFLVAFLSKPTLGKDKDFERFRQQQQQEFQEYSDRFNEEYDAFVAAERAAFEQFKTAVEQQWGEYTGSTRKDWVEYGPDLNRRSRVDLEQGQAAVEVLVENEDQARSALKKAVVELIEDKGTSADYAVEMPDGTQDEPQPLGASPVLEGQVARRDRTPVTRENTAAFAGEVAVSDSVVITKVTGKDGRQRVKATATWPLVPDHLRKRAERYLPLVRQYAEQFKVEVPLICAVMHTESFFNPKARSPIPALGLMQLVPKSGGRDAYRFVYEKDRLLPPSYLFDPKRNIELGCAYLHLLRHRFFAEVEDDQKAWLCVMAGYNTGAGNVSRALTGALSVDAAVPVIAGMTEDGLYRRLKEALPYVETREYLVKVVERIELYQAWQ